MTRAENERNRREVVIASHPAQDAPRGEVQLVEASHAFADAAGEPMVIDEAPPSPGW